MAEFDQYVQEWESKQGRRFVVAEYRGGRYEAPMKTEYVKLTGCTGIFGPLDYVAGNAYVYKNRRDALRRARQLFGTYDI